MDNLDRNIVGVIGMESASVLEELQSNVSYDLDESGTYFIISNKYYTAKIYFHLYKSISEVPSNCQAIILVTDSENVEETLKKNKETTTELKFLWLKDNPDSLGALEDLSIDYGFELLLPSDASVTSEVLTSFQVPLLSQKTAINRSISLFRALECHTWPCSSKKKIDTLTFDNAFDMIKQARDDNLASNNTKERVNRATKAIMGLKQFLE